MDVDNLKSEIFKLTKNNDIFIKEEGKEFTVWACTDNSELYTIYINIWIYDSFIIIRNYEISFYLRGKGIGSRFYDIFEEYLKSQNFKEIRLHLVLTIAEKFWKKKGFSKNEGVWTKTI